MINTADDIRWLNERIEYAGQFAEKLRDEISYFIRIANDDCLAFEQINRQ